MKLELILRHTSAYFNPSMFFIADNQKLTIKLQDCEQAKGDKYLLVNGEIYAFDENKELQIPATKLKDNNACTLQVRNADGKVLRSWKTDNLHRPPVDRKITEEDARQFETEKALLYSIEQLTGYVKTLATALADAERRLNSLTDTVNGKYTVVNIIEE